MVHTSIAPCRHISHLAVACTCNTSCAQFYWVCVRVVLLADQHISELNHFCEKPVISRHVAADDGLAGLRASQSLNRYLLLLLERSRFNLCPTQQPSTYVDFLRGYVQGFADATRSSNGNVSHVTGSLTVASGDSCQPR